MCQEFTLFCFFKKKDALHFFPTDLLLMIIDRSTTETVVDIVLDVPENFHGNVGIEVFCKVAACQHVVC